MLHRIALSWRKTSTGPGGHTLICVADQSATTFDILTLNETNFLVLQATQDTGCRFLLTTRVSAPLLLASLFSIRNTFWWSDKPGIFGDAWNRLPTAQRGYRRDKKAGPGE